MKSKTILWIVVAALVAVVAFLVMKPAGGGVENVGPDGLKQAQAAGARVIDVRSPGEYAAGHVPGAENVTLDQLATSMAGWDKTAAIAVYCQSGARSATAVQALEQAGFTNIKHMNQGIIAWDPAAFGALESGEMAAATTTPSASGKAMFYEFYTDW